MNACPYEYANDTIRPCRCAPAMTTKYPKRISGPLLDRIDIHIEVPRVNYEKLRGDRMEETSESIRKRMQATRYKTLLCPICNMSIVSNIFTVLF